MHTGQCHCNPLYANGTGHHGKHALNNGQLNSNNSADGSADGFTGKNTSPVFFRKSPDATPSLTSIPHIRLIYGKNKEPTSGLEPLTCSLRVIHQVLQGFARDCKSCISKPLSFLCLALCCTVLRARWYQSGIRWSQDFTLWGSG